MAEVFQEIKFLMELIVRRGLPPGLMFKLLASIADFIRRNPDFLDAPKIMAQHRDEAPRTIFLIVTDGGVVGTGILLTPGGDFMRTAAVPRLGGLEYNEDEDLSEWIERIPEELLGGRGAPDVAARIDARVFDIVRQDLSDNSEEDALYVCCRAILRALKLRLIDIVPAPFHFDVFSEINAEDILYRFRERFGFRAPARRRDTIQ